MISFLTTIIVAGATLIGLLILGAIFLLGLRLFRPKPGTGGPGLDQNEAKLMQELYQELENLNARMDNLESILLRGDGKGGPS